MNREYFRIAWNAITKRKVRSWLTAIGIVIGIAAVIALISTSNGLKTAILEQFDKMGTRNLYLMPKGAMSGSVDSSFTESEKDFIERLPYFEEVFPMKYIQNGKMEFKKETQYTDLIGMEAGDFTDYMASMDLEASEGRLFQRGEKYSVIVGFKFAADRFKDELRVGNSIYINDRKFRIVGIMEEIGNAQDDNQVYIPLEAFSEITSSETGYYAIMLTVKTGLDIDETVDKIKDAFSRKRDNDYFEILTTQDMLKSFNEVLGILNIVLGGIAAISLLVGGIGIMNSMFTNVLERRREIGIMKSIGGRNSDILKIFLIEAMIVGAIGGAIGSILGYGISEAIEAYAWAAGFKMLTVKVDIPLMLFGVGFAVIIAGISGYLPARRAAKLQVVDSLRG